MTGNMCAIIKEKPEKGLTYKTDIPIPQINDDEILVKVRAAAVCGTDVHIYNWEEFARKRMTPPSIVGHEMAGDVVEVGAKVKGIKVGDRVSAESHIFCGECYFCKNDMLDNMGDGQWVDSAPWGAEQAYYVCRTDSATPIRYLLCYPNRIVELRMDWTPTPEQMAIIAAAFG